MASTPASPTVAPAPFFKGLWHRVVQGAVRCGSLDCRSLALLRVGLASILLWDLMTRWPDAEAFYTDVGILTREFVWQSYFVPGGWSLHLLSGELWVQGLLFVLAGVVALLLLVGYHTRLVTLLSWGLLLSLQNRAPVVLHGGDELLRALLMWGVFLPLGARFSVDAALNSNPENRSSQVFSLGGVALLFQMAAMYLFSALHKTGPEWTTDGTALYYALNLKSITTPLGQWILGEYHANPESWADPFRWASRGTLWLEYVAPCLLMAPLGWLRGLAIALLGCFHLKAAALFQLGFFPWVCLLGLLALLPEGIWQWVARKCSQAGLMGEGMTLFYDGECRFCKKGTALWKTFLLLGDARMQPAQEDVAARTRMETEHTWVVRLGDGREYTQAEAVGVTLAHSPLWFWVSFFVLHPLLLKGWTQAYQWVARNREYFFTATRWLVWRPQSGVIPRWQQTVTALLLVWVLWLNVLSLNPEEAELPQWVLLPTVALGLGQSWSMFAPAPLNADGTYTVRGVIEGRPEAVDNVETVLELSNERWVKLFLLATLPQPQGGFFRQFGDYWCARWPAEVNQPRHVDILFSLQVTPPPAAMLSGRAQEQVSSVQLMRQTLLLWRQPCSVPLSSF